MPVFTNFVVKIHELCNINCTYCYMYNLADYSYLGRPKRMPIGVRDAFFRALTEHVIAHQLGDIVIYLHGGEPLLAGKRYLDDWVSTLRRHIPDPCNVIVILQTNGMLLDDEWVRLLHKHKIRVGVSLDGPREFHDEFRRTAAGQGTFHRVWNRLCFLRQHSLGAEVFGSILSVANPRIPPTSLWQTWRDTGFERFDFNLPHCTHDSPPWFSQEELTRWMVELFDIWWTNNDPSIDIRFFRNIIHLLLGAGSSTDYIGGKQVGIVVIETDGGIQGTDALRACEHGMIDVGLNVQRDSIQSAMTIPLVRDCNHGSTILCATCQKCGVRDACGGGYVPHRYRRANGFENPSVYCESLFAIIMHIRNTMLRSAPEIWPALQLDPSCPH